MANSFEIEDQTFAEFGEFVSLLKQMIDFLSDGLRAVRRLSLSNDHRYLVVISLMYEAQRSVLAASELWCRGYYSQALAVARPAFESFLLCKWLELHPERAVDVLDGSENERFNFFRDMANELDEEHPNSKEAGFSIYQWYDQVSDRIHPRSSMIAPSLLILDNETGDVYLGPRFRPEMAIEVARYIGVLVFILPGAFDTYLREYENPDAFLKLRGKHHDIQGKLERIFEEWRKSSGPDMG